MELEAHCGANAGIVELDVAAGSFGVDAMMKIDLAAANAEGISGLHLIEWVVVLAGLWALSWLPKAAEADC